MSDMTQQQRDFAKDIRLRSLAEAEFPYPARSEFYWASDDEAKERAIADAKAIVDRLRDAFTRGAKKGCPPPTRFTKLFELP